MKIPVDLKVGLSGRFKIEKIKNNRRQVLLDWFPNLITNNGLNLMVGSAKFNKCFVGSGSGTPQVSDTQLESLIAESDSAGSIDSGIDTNNKFTYMRRTFTFDAGSATGNLSEIGVGASSTDLFSRALILDDHGNPTTITVLSDEILVVTYECRVNQPLGDYNLSVDGYSVVLRAQSIGDTDAWAGPHRPIYMDTEVSTADPGRASAWTGPIGDVYSTPSGTRYGRSSVSTDSYNDNSYTLTGEILFDISDANDTLTAFSWSWAAMGGWQMSVDPPIVKTSSDELRIKTRVTWGRAGELTS